MYWILRKQNWVLRLWIASKGNVQICKMELPVTYIKALLLETYLHISLKPICLGPKTSLFLNYGMPQRPRQNILIHCKCNFVIKSQSAAKISPMWLWSHVWRRMLISFFVACSSSSDMYSWPSALTRSMIFTANSSWLTLSTHLRTVLLTPL